MVLQDTDGRDLPCGLPCLQSELQALLLHVDVLPLDQSLFTNVTSVQNAYDNNRTAVESIDFFVADSYGQSFYDSCKVNGRSAM